MFEPDGTYIGAVVVPDGVRLLQWKGDRVWGVSTDSLDVSYLTQYRIAWR